MGLTPEQIAAAFLGLVLGLGALGQYLRTLRSPAKPLDPVLVGIGIGYGDKEQAERLIAATVRMAVAMETLADKRTGEMVDIHKALLERLDAQQRREEQEEQRPRRSVRRPPPGR